MYNNLIHKLRKERTLACRFQAMLGKMRVRKKGRYSKRWEKTKSKMMMAINNKVLEIVKMLIYNNRGLLKRI